MSNKELIQFLETEELQDILKEYRQACQMSDSAGFNVFKIISDYYYRENFHGDILMAFLDSKGEHTEGDKFLKIFIEMLGVDTDKYGPSTTVEREVGLTGEAKGRIDFVIKNNDKSEPHCIIIENKLYDAVDMPEQLTRYFTGMTEQQKQEVDKIVYLPLSVGKRPEGPGKEVEELLMVIPAIDIPGSKCSLVKEWIDPCIDAANNPDCKSILRQYKRLLISLKPEIAKYKSSMELYEYLCKDDNLKKVLDLRKMLDDFGKPLSIRLAKKLEESGCRILGPDKENGIRLNLSNGYSLWIYCGDTENLDYVMKIVDTDNTQRNPDTIEWLPDSLKNSLTDRVKNINDHVCMVFELTKEQEFISNIQQIISAANSQNIQ